MLNIDISDFLQQEKLTHSYTSLIKDWFCPLADSIATHHNGANKPLVVGINGAQGSGKSTLAACLVYLLTKQFGLNAISLSIDDFYFTKQERTKLAETIHPLLATRGVPGTHDIALARNTISHLLHGHTPVTLPRFNKAIDDRFSAEECPVINHQVDIIIMEGWCMGSTAQNESALNQAVNSLESEEDSDGEWRHYVNDQLSRFYPKLFELVDLWVMLKAPSFESVYQWRLEQEDKLRAVATNGTHVMSEEQVARFIKFYQRITEHTLMTLPEQVHYLYEMDDTRTITKMTCRSSIFSHMEKHWLVFTDMDGSLLDHHDYSYDPAIPTLEALEQAQIPVIPVTSKTQAEVEFIRETIDNTHPFIVENGAAVCIPVGYFPHQPAGTEQQGQFWIKSFCESRSRWQALIDELRPRYPDQFKTFAEAGIDGIIAMTGLNVHAAALAAHRQYGEPVSWHGNGQLKQSFINDLKAAGANVLEGGRFIHVSGNCDKGRALNWLKQIYQSAYPTKQMISLGIGDSHNDKAMLESADHALIIRSPTHGLPEVNRQNNLTISTHTGPKGWAEGVNNIIDAALHSNSSQQPRGNHG